MSGTVFDLDRLEAFARREITAFAAQHPDELFHAFAIDAAMLCLSPVSDVDDARAYADSQGRTLSPAEIDEVRRETGDYRYQGFATMTPEVGFDATSVSARAPS